MRKMTAMRCFLAIELPADVRDRLAELQERLSSLGRAVRWMRSDQIHLTLKFLGEVPDEKVPSVCQAAATVAGEYGPFELELRGTGCFPPGGQARIVWAGIIDPPQTLIDCQRACEQACAELGFKKENRKYVPHLTVGRVRDSRASREIRAAVECESQFSAGPFVAGELVLFQSILRPSGPTYHVVSRAGLGGGG